MDRVREILLDIAQAHPQVMRTPAPNVVFMGFGVLALDVELRCFVANVEHALATRSDINFAILRRFREAGIEIPPQSGRGQARGEATFGAAPNERT